MNIAFVNSTHRWGGVKTWTLDVAAWMARNGHTPLLIARPGPFTEKSREMGIETLDCAFGFDFHPGLIAHFHRLFRERRIDVVVCNVGKDLRTAGVAAKLAGIPVVHRVGLPGDMKNAFKVRALHRFIKPAILVPCEFIKEGLQRELPHLKPEEITVILTGKRPIPQPPEQISAPLRLIITSQLNPDKRHVDVLHALASLKAKGYRFRLDVLATGSSENELKALTQDLGLGAEVHWHGFQKNVREHLRKADVFILASRSEGLPNTLLEAMAEGLVPVSRSVGGVKEIWPEELAPLLSEREEAHEKLEAALETVLKASPEDIRDWKKAAWTACRERFDLDTQAGRITAWLEEIATGK